MPRVSGRLASIIDSASGAFRKPPQAPLADLTPPNLYEELYEGHIRAMDDEEIAGPGDFDRIGRIELSVLVQEGLLPTHTLVDFGCGTGRLAVHAIPFLTGGHYVGIDISETALERAKKRVERTFPAASSRATWIHHAARSLPLQDQTVDVLCAFSVFTHMEHEDTYRYLVDARRVVRSSGRLVLSCLPLDLEAARAIFIDASSYDVRERWGTVRNVTTSRDLMNTIAELAGWRVLRWYTGDEKNIALIDSDERVGLGQSICVFAAQAG